MPGKIVFETDWFMEKNIIRTRLNLPLDGLVSDGELPPKSNSKSDMKARFDAIRGALEPYGLIATRFIDDGSLDANEPFWIHHSDLNPKGQFPETQ